MLDTLVQASYADRRFVMRVLGAFAVLALLLAAIGLYGVIACTVSERTREVGLRVALGATKQDVLRLVFASGARAIAAGLIIGVVASQLLTRFMDTMLVGTTVTDPVASAVAVGALGTVTALAHWIPAPRLAGRPSLGAEAELTLRTLPSRIAGIFRQRRRDRELDDEVRFHLEMTAKEGPASRNVRQ